MTPKFKTGDRVRWIGATYPQYGAQAVVTEPQHRAGTDTYVRIEWDRKHTAHQRNNGGYYEKDFELVAAAKPANVKKETQAYKGNGKHEWELVVSKGDEEFSVWRLRVLGGYLYRTLDQMVFVPMPEVVKHKV